MKTVAILSFLFFFSFPITLLSQEIKNDIPSRQAKNIFIPESGSDEKVEQQNDIEENLQKNNTVPMKTIQPDRLNENNEQKEETIIYNKPQPLREYITTPITKNDEKNK